MFAQHPDGMAGGGQAKRIIYYFELFKGQKKKRKSYFEDNRLEKRKLKKINNSPIY